MQINFQAPGRWQDLNEKLTGLFPELAPTAEVRVYPSVGSALVEVVLGLTKMYPLKKKVAYIKDQDPFFDYPLMLLAREGYEMVPIAVTDLGAPERWMNHLDRATLLLLYSVTDPLLGIEWPVEKLESSVRESSFQKIRVVHPTARDTQSLWIGDRNTTTVFGVTDGALAFAGERARLMGVVMPTIPWDSEDWLNRAKKFREKTTLTYTELVMSFEKRKVSGALPALDDSNKIIAECRARRLYDRVALYWPDKDGEAIVDRLKTHWNDRFGQSLDTSMIFTTSLTYWGGTRTMDWLKQLGFTSQMIRGTVLVDGSLIVDSEKFENILTDVCLEIDNEQQGRGHVV